MDGICSDQSAPAYGWLPPAVSIAWMATSVLLCSYWAARLARGFAESVLFMFGTLGIFAYAAPNKASLVGPLITALGSLAIGAGASLLLGTGTDRRGGVLSY